MSRQPTDPRIAESLDLARLAADGYALEIRGGHLVLHDVPYVTKTCELRRGKLVAPITFAGDVAAAPGDHVAMWSGEHPCHKDGRLMGEIVHTSQRREVESGLVVDHSFSAKPQPSGHFPSFYEKMTEYVHRIAGPAEALDPSMHARTNGIIEGCGEQSVFRYTENASALAGIGSLTPRLAVGKIAIVGTGGTGGYILDFVAKTPVQEIHLYDGDDFLQHNAFRAPGAASLAELRTRPSKVEYLRSKYDPMRRGIIAHPYAIDASNVTALLDMHTVFVCADSGAARKLIVDKLRGSGVHCIIVGMGLYQRENGLGGQIATTAAGPGAWEHVEDHVSFGERDADADAYGQNIQIAELNALNAAMAVIRWKKQCGFLIDLEYEGHSVYLLEANAVANIGVTAFGSTATP